MNDLVKRLAELPPEKRRLLVEALKRKGAQFNSFPLSFAQQRLWFLQELEPDSALYTIPGRLDLDGSLDQAALERSLHALVQRHEVLRTAFISLDGQPVQIIQPTLSLAMPVVDLQTLPAETQDAELRRLSAEQMQQRFDLAIGPLIRVTLARLAPDRHVLLVTMHHIISDGWSLAIFVRELTALYQMEVTGAQASAEPGNGMLPALSIQYADYAQWQRERLQGPLLDTQISYWQQQLGGTLPILELPTDRPRPATQTFNGARYPLALPQPLTAALNTLSQREGVTLFMTLLAAFQTFLYRYTGQDDILVGSPIAGRTRAETEGLLGCFVNTLVLRADLSDNPAFRALLQQVRSVALAAYRHQEVPFEKLVEVLHPDRSQSHAPLFQVMFVLQSGGLDPVTLPELMITPKAVYSPTAKFDLTLDLQETPDGLRGSIEYNTDLFEPETIGRMVAHLTRLLESIVADPARQIGALELLSAAERQRIVVEWNATQAVYPADQCYHTLVEAQAARTPDAVAVVCGDTELTYRDLNERANRVAHALQALGIGPDARVGLCMERSPELVIGLLGILKAGGAYVPLDPSYPQERLHFMLADAQMPVVLTQRRLQAADSRRLPADGAQIVEVDGEWTGSAEYSAANPRSTVTPDHIAYIIYTSGSTGQPKGTMIPHRGLVNYVSWAASAYRITEGCGTIVHSPIGFDLTVTSLLVPLAAGQRVLLLPEDQQLDDLAEALQSSAHFSLVKLTPAHVDLLNHVLSPETLAGSANALIIGGEALRAETVEYWRECAPQTRLVNEYGPTETVVGCCVYDVPPTGALSSTLPIGRPIANMQLYVLDRHLNPVPTGVPGELYIGGAQMGRGYLNRPALTAEQFMPDPFSDVPNARLYRTGDLARYLPDGMIEFLGRIDHQVKVRGFRIELGEIEAVLSEHPAVREVVVLAREDTPGDKQLVAYVVPNESQDAGCPLGLAPVLASYLHERLPDYMVPSAFVLLDTLPLTANGKIDRRALPAPDTRSNATFVAPSTPLEEVVANMWSEVLNIEPIGIHDNFFDLGGHSLLATQLIAQIRDTFQVDLPLRSVFSAPTVASLSAAILQHAAVPARVEKTAQLLIQIAQMSDNEVETMLVDQSQPHSGKM